MKQDTKRELTPKLRFPEFRDAGEWEKKKMGDEASFYKGKGISKADIDLNGKTPCIRYGELYTHYGEVIDTVISTTNLSTSGLFLSRKNDVIIPASGETKLDIATASCVMCDDIVLGGDLNVILSRKNDVIIPASGETKLDIATASCVMCDDIVLGGDLNVIRSNHNGIFISYYLNGLKKNDIAKIAQGDTVVHLYPSQLEQIEIIIPKAVEQQKIADCLSSIDELIAAQTQKLDALKAHKKGLMQQLFPSLDEVKG